MSNHKLRICIECGNEFKPTSDSQRYCENCQILALEGKLKRERICQRCGKEFIPIYKNQRNCEECIPIVRQERETQNPLKLIHCVKCGKEFMPRSHNQIYCKECKIILDKERLEERQNKNGVCFGDEIIYEDHHINDTILLRIPQGLHQLIFHDRKTGKGMIVINALAWDWLIWTSIEKHIKVECLEQEGIYLFKLSNSFNGDMLDSNKNRYD